MAKDKKKELEHLNPDKESGVQGTVDSNHKPTVNTVDPQTGSVISSEAPKTKKRRGRPPKKSSFKFTESMVASGLRLPFNFMAGRWGAHWALTQDEESSLIPAATQVVNKYVPSWLEKYGEEISLATILFFIIANKSAQGFGGEPKSAEGLNV